MQGLHEFNRGVNELNRGVNEFNRGVNELNRGVNRSVSRQGCNLLRAAVTSAVTSQDCCCGNLQIHPLDLGQHSESFIQSCIKKIHKSEIIKIINQCVRSHFLLPQQSCRGFFSFGHVHLISSSVYCYGQHFAWDFLVSCAQASSQCQLLLLIC